ncbi:Tn7-like element transposition protein TnsE [Spartinivicinus ruber]|uniref:Tn7-like element transposition protein TnsE n=1 Tax=Spartinivicinus ruber TaxID=2683272 RepID=UPI0013D77814|nr:Tn7-like element transposition protein TnsE [Spartinivicinus ruber]
MASNTYFKGIPEGSKLLLLGDLYRKPSEGWKIVAYFLTPENQPLRKAFPIDAIPALTVGSIFPITSDNQAITGYRGRFILPPTHLWQQKTYKDMPGSLQRMSEYYDQLKDQVVFCIESEHKIYWLPSLELARRLHLCSAELVRVAMLEGTTRSIANVSKTNWEGTINLMPDIPIAYLNNQEYRKYFTWLLFNNDAENSFCSIYRHQNKEARIESGVERWSFNFTPPSLEGCEISWSGFTDGEQNHHYIRRIQSIAGLPSPPLEKVWFSHPDDQIVITDSENKTDRTRTTEQTKASEKNEIDPDATPRPTNKHRLLTVSPAGLHFDLEIDMKRSPRHVQFLPAGEQSDVEEKELEDSVGITQSDATGTVPRADIDTRIESDLVEAQDKFTLFHKLLEQLEQKHSWKSTVQTGNVPRCNCKTAHLIDGRERQYSFVTLQRDENTIVYLLEIELKPEQSLSTLIYRADPAEECNLKDQILKDLMSNSVKWERRNITEQTVSRYYLDHPDKKIKNEDEALESWVARAAYKINLI